MNEYFEEAAQFRTPNYDIQPLLCSRWSARSMTGERLDEADLMALFEAARWAPSANNRQPWRFRYATRESDEWETFLGLLSEKNQRWCKHAGALILVVSRTTSEDEGAAIRNHSFTTGGAWMNLALEGICRGLAVHPMQGFDVDRARDALEIPERYHIEIMTAVGVRGPREALPEDLREQEYPKGRRPLEELFILN